MKLPRGLRNNNPLNIIMTPQQKKGENRWQGMKEEQTDGRFCQFKDMKYGWRAAFILLTRNYYYVRRLHSPYAIISCWAPSSDGNNVQAYVRKVCQLAGFKPDQQLQEPHSHPGEWMKLAVAMAVVENGQEAFDYFAMMDGWDMCREFAQKHVAGKIG